MPEEAASLSNPGQGANGALTNLAAQQQAARDLTAARRADVLRAQEAPAGHAETAALEEIDEETDEAQIGRDFAAGQREARRGNGGVAGADLGSALSDITGIADELTDVVTFVVEIETILVPLLILAKWDLQIIGGNLNINPVGFVGATVKVCDWLVDICSVGGKTAAKAGTSAAGGAGKSTGSFGGGDFGAAKPKESAPAGGGSDVKALSTPLMLTAIVLTVVVLMSVMVSLIALFIVPIIIIAGIGLACAGFENVCTGVINMLGSAYTAIRSVLSPG